MKIRKKSQEENRITFNRLKFKGKYALYTVIEFITRF